MSSLANYLSSFQSLQSSTNTHRLKKKSFNSTSLNVSSSSTSSNQNFQVEKYNSKLNIWSLMYLTIDKSNLKFYDKKTDKKPKEFFSLEKIKIKFFKNYKRGSMKKSNVITFSMDSATLSKCTIEDCNYNFLISFKNELCFLKAQEALKKAAKPENKGVTRLKMNRTKSFNTIMETNECLGKENVCPNLQKRNARTRSCFDFSKEKVIIKENNKDEKKDNNESLISILNQISTISPSYQKEIEKSSSKDKTHISTKDQSTNSNAKRKEQINTLINMSLISENNSRIYPHKNVKSILDINSSEVNIVVTLGNETDEISITNVPIVLSQLDSFEIFLYDSNILLDCLKTNSMKKKHLGLLYLGTKNEIVKHFLLIEMIAIISKQFLSQSIVKSLEVVLKEKEINPNFSITSAHPHSIEYCICDLFNTFLSINEGNYYHFDLYNKILPVYIKDTFDIENEVIAKPLLTFAIGNNNMNALFASMQSHNRIYFANSTSLDFTTISPIKSQNIKFISPYYINKWHMKANDITSNLSFLTSPSHSNSAIPKNVSSLSSQITSTNAKRIKSFSNITSNVISKQIANFKSFDLSNNHNRICIVNSIYNYILKKQYHLAVKLCDYYLEKYSDSLFLNCIVYMYLGEIYNVIKDVSLAKMFFNKAIETVKWLYGNKCHFQFEIEYNLLLVLLKQSDEYIMKNLDEIKNVLNECEKLSKHFYKKMHYKVGIQQCIFELNYVKQSEAVEDELWKEYRKVKEYLHEMKENGEKGEELYWDLFIDLFGKFINTPKEIKSDLIKEMYSAYKNVKY